MKYFRQDGDRIIYSCENLSVWIEPYGRDVIRIRQSINPAMPDRTFALLPPVSTTAGIELGEDRAAMTSGALRAAIDKKGILSFARITTQGSTGLLSETNKHFTTTNSDLSRITLDFSANEEERFYGLGQHSHGMLDQKGCVIDLKQVNTQVAIPLLISNRSYGFLWHDPSTGHVELARNRTRWVADASRGIDYLVFTGDSYAEIMERYAGITGLPPQLPEWAAGFWQCKLRYRTQDELLGVAREYKKRGLPLSVIVIDFFHWTMMGEFRFDPKYWPDPAAMVRELKELGVELAVSIWPMINFNSCNYAEMKSRGLLVRPERGAGAQHQFIDTYPEGKVFTQYYDATNPQTMEYVWEKVREHYHAYGIRVFWLDNCEPDLAPPDFDNVRFHLGNGSEVACVYPLLNAKGFYDGLVAQGEKEVVTLCRSGWAGSQRYGSIIWSGDIASTFESLHNQVRAGLNMAMSGIPWWTTDIGGFHGGNPDDPVFRELIVRWFQYGVFCPVFRLHGVRAPANWSNVPEMTGAANEAWSFGEKAYDIIAGLIKMRERLMPYIMEQMNVASRNGTPPMRPLFFDFPGDPECYRWEDEFLFGPDILVAPVTAKGATSRQVYLPAGTAWRNAWSGETHQGGTILNAAAPLEVVPVFIRGESDPGIVRA